MTVVTAVLVTAVTAVLVTAVTVVLVTVVTGGTGDGGDDGTTGTSTGTEHTFAFELNQNYPNPFSGQTRIDFELATPSRANLSIYDTAGRLVEVLVNENLSAGNHSVTFHADNLSSGVYVCQLTTRMGTRVNRMVLVR